MVKSIIATILKIVASIFGRAEKREENFDKHELKRLDEEALQLEKDIYAAVDAGNSELLSQRQNAHALNRQRAKALRGS